MTQPQAYNRETDFTERDGDDTNHAGINTELDAAALSINQLRDNLALIQADDGGLKAGIVKAESLDDSAFDAILVDVNLAVSDAQTAAQSANIAALSANAARDQAVTAKENAETANNAAALNASTAALKAAETASAVAQAVDGEKDLFVAGVGYTKGTTTQLTLAYAPAKSGTVKVFFDGVFQHLTEWSLAGNVITFTAAIPADKVEVHYVIPSQFVGLSNADLEVLGDAQAVAQAEAATATAQAALATTQAGLAATAKTAAELARDAALIQAGVYATEAAGRAAVADGVAFKVQGSGDVAAYEYRRTNSTTSVLIATYPSVSAVKDNIESVRHAMTRIETDNNPWYEPAPDLDSVSRIDNAATWTLTNAAVNADGTITIQAGGSIKTPNMSSQYATAAQWFYFWITEVDPLYANNPLSFSATFNNVGGLPTSSRSITEVENGVHKIAIRNNNGSGTPYSFMNLTVSNGSASAVKIYPIMCTWVDSATPPRIRRTDAREVSADFRTIQAFDWYRNWGRDRTTKVIDERRITKSANSVSGLDANAGTGLRTPKQTLGALPALASNDILGLGRGSLWREAFPTTTSITDLAVVDATGGSQGERFPILSCMKSVPNAQWTDNGNGTYSHTWAAIGGTVLANDGYNVVYAVEVNTSTEAAFPLTSQKRLVKVANAAAVAATAGTEFVESLGGGNWKATIRPTDSSAPGTLYRYEVVQKRLNLQFFNDAAGRVLSGMELVGSSEGYGQLGMTFDGVVDRVVFVHGTAHQVVQRSGIIQRSVFYAPSSPEGPMVTFYTADGQSRRWEIRQSFIFARDPIYSHISAGTNYKRGVGRDLILVNARDAYGTLKGNPIGGESNDEILYERIYAQNYAASGVAQNVTIRNSLFRNVARYYLVKRFENNIVRLENFNDPNSVNNRGASANTQGQVTGSVITKNLFHFKYIAYSPVLGSDSGCTLYGSDPIADFNRNIYIIDGFAPVMVSWTNAVGPRYTADYNVIINIGTTDLSVFRSGSFTVTGWGAYVSFSGRDTNSLYINLRGDPRGLKAIFIDADNGDFGWADTDIARRVSDYCRLNKVGPDWTIRSWPTIPTADEAAQLIRDI